MSDDELTSPTSERNRPSTGALEGVRCLIVEDEEDVATSMSRLFRRHGMTAETVGTVSGALELLAQCEWDLVVVDLILADGDGLNVLEAIHQRPARPAIVVASGSPRMSGRPEVHLLADMVVTKSGVGDYLLGVAEEAVMRALAAHGGPCPERAKAAEAREAKGAEPALTPREHEIFELLKVGHSSKAVAQRLGIGDGTVRTHGRAVYRKRGFTNLRECLVAMLKGGG